MSVKKVTDSIVDEQLDVAALAEQAYAKGKTLGRRIEEMARAVMEARVKGKLNAARGKQLLREGMLVLVLNEYADLVGPMQALEDKALAEQAKALSALDAPLSSVPFVRDADFAARVTEKEQEKLNGGQ